MTSWEGLIQYLLLPGGSSNPALQPFERVRSAPVLGGTISAASIESVPQRRNQPKIYGARKTEGKEHKQLGKLPRIQLASSRSTSSK